MSSRSRLFIIGILTLILGVTLFMWRPSSSAVLYSGYARADSDLISLEVSINPPVGSPGTLMQMTARVSNRGSQPLTPSIVLRLPRGAAADMYALPAGATFNLQENQIDWLPVVPAAGTVEFALDMVVQSTDVITPEQFVEALLRHQGQQSEAFAPIWIGITPLVGEVMAQGQASVGQPVRLRADISGPGPITTVWDLGDGRRLELDAPEIVFPVAGEHEIVVEAYNPAGRITRRFLLNVLPQPVAAFQPDDEAPAIGQSVTFRSTSGGQPPLRVFWDFGDGTTVMGEQQPSHAYRQGGTYRVRLAIENEFGRSEAVWDMVVGDAPIADVVIPDHTAVGLPISAQAFGDDTVTRYLWDMGDGRRHEGDAISHLYRQPGDYYVTMTADNGFGQTQVGRWVRVEAGTTTLFLPLAAHAGDSTLSVLSADTLSVAELSPVVETIPDGFTLEPIQFSAETSPAEKLLAYLNAARARFGLPPMNYAFELSSAAQTHAQDKARFPDNPHVGTDGTTAAERLLRSGYRGGYAGEATAWGFADPREAVEFWVNSDSHRPLILNQLGTEVGIGYVEDYASKNVWHWTAEFGISYGAPVRPELRVLAPAAGHNALDTEVVNYSWMWPLPLGSGERFTAYLETGNRLIPLGSVAQPVYGSRYILSVDARAVLGGLASNGSAAPSYDWIVRLEDGVGNAVAESGRRLIAFTADPENPIATPVPTLPIITATPIAPTPTATPTMMPTDEPPSNEPPPVIVTATPQPTSSPEPPPAP